MTHEKRLYRSRDALVGGVCAGVADFFNLDPVVVRILAVALTLLSSGILGVAYVAMWVILPQAPRAATPLDVQPEAVHSDTYGPVSCGPVGASDGQDSGGAGTPAQAASARYAASVPYAGAAHVPPEPPASVVQSAGAAARIASDRPNGAHAPAPGSQTACQPAVAPGYCTWHQPHHAAPARGAVDRELAPTSVKAALWVGSILLFMGIVGIGATFVEGVSWWQYWPLIFMILGIVQMVVPGTPGRRMFKFVTGLICFSAATVLLTMSLELVAWRSLGYMLANLWPLLVMMLGFLVLGVALKAPVLTFLAGCCFIAFCVVGLAWYWMPGVTDEIVLAVPYGREYHFFMP